MILRRNINVYITELQTLFKAYLPDHIEEDCQMMALSKARLKEIAIAYGSGHHTKLNVKDDEVLQIVEALLAAHEQEPVQPIWGAAKYPVSRPSLGSKLIVWDEVGKFVGYGHAVDTHESGVAIQMNDGRRFDSNYELRWQYALHPALVPAVPDDLAGKSFEYIANKFQVSISEAQWILVGWNACRAACSTGINHEQNT